MNRALVCLLLSHAHGCTQNPERPDMRFAVETERKQAPLREIAILIELLPRSYADALQAQARGGAPAVLRFEELIAELPPKLRAPPRYHLARMWALSGDVPKAAGILDELRAMKPPLPEALLLRAQ